MTKPSRNQSATSPPFKGGWEGLFVTGIVSHFCNCYYVTMLPFLSFRGFVISHAVSIDREVVILDKKILHLAIHIVWRVNVICICRKPGIARKTAGLTCKLGRLF